MNKRLTKILQIYSFIFLFAVGIGMNALVNNSSDTSLPFVEDANATIELNQNTCPGYKQAKQDDELLVTMCNCSTQRAEGMVDCSDDGGPTDPGEN